MRKILLSFFLLFIGQLHTKIIDCFLYLNEEDVLRIHLEELYECVDKFVIVEANETFSGLSKDFRFEKIKDRFAKYQDKIVYVKVTEKVPGDNPWPRESFQRNQIMQGLTDCSDSDIIIICDIDEIVKARHLSEGIAKLNKKTPVIGCECDFYRWFLNRKDSQRWVGPAITTFRHLKKNSPESVRGSRHNCIFDKSAWHFSNLGGATLYLEKMQSFSHYKEVDVEGTKKDLNQFYQSIRTFELVPIDESFPKYVQENLKFFKAKNFIDSESGSYY